MIVLKNLIAGLSVILDYGLNIYMWLIIARALLSWVSPDPYNPIVRFLYRVTEPVLSYVRRRLPVIFGGIDFSPILILAAIIFLQRFLVGTLQDWARLMS
jgi:YggT family protein